MEQGMEGMQKHWAARMSQLDAELRRELRSAYDVRVLLDELAEKTRSLASRQELGAVLQKLIEDALQPKSFCCYFKTEDFLLASSNETSGAPQTIPATLPLLAGLARRSKTWNTSERDTEFDLGILCALAPDCLVPILGRAGHLVGLLVLGPRASGEPYRPQDTDLLDSVANQAGIALESLRLAERIAERMEAERRLRQEIDVAKQVQARLLPQILPRLTTLDYLGRCIQARQVGGDYYDFLEMRPGRLAFVLADVAGKGLAGALLMANLQANLRSQYPMALGDLRRFLISVNDLFYENTDDGSYATIFFGDYDDANRRLRYVNCGHLPPILLRAIQRPTAEEPVAEKLAATATVLGLFQDWDCKVAETQLGPGDTLVLYTDGVTEATDAQHGEFGEARLLALLNENRHLPARALLQAVIDAVEQFQHGEQSDDITLVVARCRA